MTHSADDVERSGVRHLREIAREPRAAGSAGEARARAYAAGVLRDAGFDVREETFEYSRFPGSYGTPIIGALLVVTVVSAAVLAPNNPIASVIVLALGLIAAFVGARAMLGDGVLHNPWMRTSGINLVATRGSAEPRVWLVAHLDSKSQPVPSAVRVAGVIVLSTAVILAVLAAGLTLADVSARMVWWAAVVAAVVGGLSVMASVVGNDSLGALDNASGVAAVLVAATGAKAGPGFGVLLPSAEELGLAGARAFAAARPPGIALNCDGVDDNGQLVIMHSGKSQTELVEMLVREARQPVAVRRMPPGLLTDSSAFAEKGWKAVTLSHGTAASLRRVHTRRDSLTGLAGDAIRAVGDVLILAMECLSIWA